MPKKPNAATESDDERLLTLGELARYLHIGQKVVLDLVATKDLPGVHIENQWRFRRSAIDNWLEQQNASDDDFEAVPDGMRIPLGDLMPDEALIGDLHAKDALSVIEELAAHAYVHNWLHDKPWFVGAVIERESLASTAMEGGVAFLHTRSRDTRKIARPFIIVGRSYKGVDFGAPDGKPTFLFFLLGLKHDALHLPILGRLARVMRNQGTVAKLRASPSSNQMRALLLKQDAAALARNRATPVEYESLKPKLDRHVRLRAIMRLTAQRKQAAREAESKKIKTTGRKAASRAAAKKPAAKKPAAKKPAAKKPAAKKAAAAKPAAKKPAAKKAAAAKPAAKKPAAKKPAAKKPAAKKPAAKKPAAKPRIKKS